MSKPAVETRTSRSTSYTRSQLSRWVGICLFGLYFLTTGGQPFISDGEIMLLTATRLIDAQTFTLPEWAMHFPQVVRGQSGQPVSRYGLGQPLLAAIMYWVGRYGIGWYLLPGSADFSLGKFVALLLPAFATAWTASLLCRWAGELYRSPARGVAIALLYGVGTLAFPYARFFFSEPLFTACLLLAAFAIFRQRPLLAGLAAGYALATRLAGGVLLPVLLLYGWLKGFRSRDYWRMFGGLLPGIALVLLNNWVRFHSLLEHGYAADEGFTGNLLVGLYGLLLSPGKSVFLYVPLLLAFPFALLPFLRRFQAEALLVGLMSLVLLTQSAWWWMWWGGWGWGPRFLVPLMPFWVLTIGILLEQPGWRRLLGGVLFPLSLLVNLLGILVNFNTYLIALTGGQKEREMIYLFQPAYSPLLAHIRRFNMETIPIVSFALDDPHVGVPSAVAPFISTGILLLTIVALWRLWLALQPVVRRTYYNTVS